MQKLPREVLCLVICVLAKDWSINTGLPPIPLPTTTLLLQGLTSTEELCGIRNFVSGHGVSDLQYHSPNPR